MTPIEAYLLGFFSAIFGLFAVQIEQKFRRPRDTGQTGVREDVLKQ
jgi:hypothetical protein